MLGREAVAARMLADVTQSQRLRFADQLAEDSASARKVADGLLGFLVDTGDQEALEFAAIGVEDPDRGVACAGQLPAYVEEALEDRLTMKLGNEPATDLEQSAQAMLTQPVACPAIAVQTIDVSRLAAPPPSEGVVICSGTIVASGWASVLPHV